MSYDIHVKLQPPHRLIDGKPFSFYYKQAVGVRGFQKLIDQWLKCLLTTKGSDLTSPEYGTVLSELVGSNVQGEAFLGFVSQAVEDCNEQVKANERGRGLPDDERLATATIKRIVSRGLDGYDVHIVITNAAGSALEVQLP